MKKLKFLLVLVLITSFVVGCGSNSSKETSKEKTKETTKKKEKVKLLHDNQYYIDLATDLDWWHYFVGSQSDLFDDPNTTYYFDDVKSMNNSQIDYYIDWYFFYHMIDYNVDQYYDEETNEMYIPMSIRNDICKMLFNKDYYKGDEGTWNYGSGGIGGTSAYTLEVENPVLHDDGTITIKSTFYDESKNVAITNTLCIKEVDKDSFRIVYVKK